METFLSTMFSSSMTFVHYWFAELFSINLLDSKDYRCTHNYFYGVLYLILTNCAILHRLTGKKNNSPHLSACGNCCNHFHYKMVISIMASNNV